MKHFSMIVACAAFALFFAACEGNNSSNKDGDTMVVADDNLLVDEDGVTPIDEEPEGEVDVDQKTDKDTVVKDDQVPVDDGTVEPDDGTVEPDDTIVVTDDATVEPDDTIVVTDDATVESDDTVIVTDDVVTDDIVADGDELLNDDDVIVYVNPCAPTNTCVDLNRSVCTDVNLDGIAECACDGGYTLDGGSTCINQKEVPCDTDNGNPANSTDVVENVTVNYTDGGGWEDPVLCAWECDDTYVKDAFDACVPEAGPCADSPCTDANKHVCADDGAGNPVCSCDEHYNDDDMNGTCEPDIQYVACTNELEANSHWLPSAPYSGEGHVTQTWDGTQFAPTADFCPQGCNTDYTLESGVCIHEKQVDCAADPAKPANSHDIIEKVTIFFVGDTWGAPNLCDWTCDDGYHWNEDVEECLETLTIDWCNLEAPADSEVAQGESLTVYGRVYIAGVTDLSAEVDAFPQIIGQLSGNPSHGVDAATWPWDGWMDLDPNPDNESAVGIGDTDEYLVTVPVMSDPGEMDITVRFSGDSGNTWTYCNANRSPAYNGTDAEDPYDPLKHGILTVVEGYLDPCALENPCIEENRTVCTDVNLDGVAECGCDDGYTLDGGSTCINEKQVDCAANPAKPADSHDIIEQVWVYYNGTDWTDPAICTVWDCNDGYHWNDTVKACLETLTIDWCNLETPTDITFYRGETASVYGRVYVLGVTDQTADVDTAPQLLVQVGSGAAGTSATGWGNQWGPMEPNPANHLIPGIGDNDEYQYIGPVTETLGDWDMSVRVSGDSGTTWTYCNANRVPEYNGTDETEPYDYLKNGHFTVTSPCDEGFCDEPNKSVCDDSVNEPYYTCSCDAHYNDNDANGTCEIDTQLVGCENLLPTNAAWRTEGAYGGGKLLQTWDFDNNDWMPPIDSCPWDCYGGYHKDGDACVPNTRVENCTDNKPSSNSHWVADGNYNGDGTVLQNWTLADGWQPPADECPWACDVDYHFRYDPFSGLFCDPDTQLVACTNTLPDNAVWRTEGVYGGGKLTQTWNSETMEYEPAADTCPSDCQSDYHWNGSACGPNVRTDVGCEFALPANAVWVESLPTYYGNGNMTQTWNFETMQYEPAGDSCPFSCTNPAYHPNNDLKECLLTYAIGWCGNMDPLSANAFPGDQKDITAELWIDGITSVSTINSTEHTIDPYMPQIMAELGAGPHGTDPTTWDKMWMPAVPNADIGNNDEYIASPVVDMDPGEYDYAYRFSGNSGQDWTYCEVGTLTVLCVSNDDCSFDPTNQICNAAGVCVDCDSNDDCDTWEQCNGSYVCEALPGKCSSNGDCETWEQCNGSHDCELAPGRCTVDDDCIADGKVCDEPTYTCKLPGKLVINEVDYDQPSTDMAEYIELFVTGEMPLVLTGLTFEFWNGSGVPVLYNSSPYDLAVNDQSVTTLNPGTYYIIAPPAVTAAVQGVCPLCVTKTITPTTNLVQNGLNDALRIMNGIVAVDGLHYAGSLPGYGEGSAGPTDPGTTGNDNISIGRCPNGQDTDDNGVDFFVMSSTPGAANTCL